MNDTQKKISEYSLGWKRINPFSHLPFSVAGFCCDCEKKNGSSGFLVRRAREKIVFEMNKSSILLYISFMHNKIFRMHEHLIITQT